MFGTRKMRALFAGMFVAALLASTFMNAPSASAYWRRHVCVDSLYVRQLPDFQVIGTLYRGHTFDIYRWDGPQSSVYGFAYGLVNQWGYVYPNYLC